jgi:hypothetical protein
MLVSGIANLPEQDEVFARHFAQYPKLFTNGVYLPTSEKADMYQQVPAHADTCSLKGREEEDFATDFLVKRVKPINIWLGKLIKSMQKKPAREDDTLQEDDSALPQYLGLKTVRTIMHLLAGVYVPTLFAGSLGILSRLETEKSRIIVLGCLGLVLTWSLILLIPTLKRSDLFAITGAFFAVGGIYIGSKSPDYR